MSADTSSHAHVSSAISLLAAFDPSSLQKLRSASEGTELKLADFGEAPVPAPVPLPQAVEVERASLQVAVQLSNAALAKAQNGLKRRRLIELCAGVLGLVSSGGTVATIVGKQYHISEVLAVIALVSSILILVSKYIGNGADVEAQAKMIRTATIANFDANRILKLFAVTPLNDPSIAGLIAQAEALSSSLIDFAAQNGLAPVSSGGG